MKVLSNFISLLLAVMTLSYKIDDVILCTVSLIYSFIYNCIINYYKNYIIKQDLALDKWHSSVSEKKKNFHYVMSLKLN